MSDEHGHSWFVFNESDWDSACAVMSQSRFDTGSFDGQWNLWSESSVHHEYSQWEVPSTCLVIRNDENEVKISLSFTLITDEEAQDEHWAGRWEDRLRAYLAWAQWLRNEGIPFMTDLPDWEDYPAVESPITRRRHIILEWATTHLRQLHKLS